MSEAAHRLEGLRSRCFRPYPKYKGSGVEWLGEIPAHWDLAPVYARYDVALGKMLDAKRVTGESSGRYLRNVDVQWNAINIENLPEMDFPPTERNRYLLRPGDLLVCEGGEVGRTAIWAGELEECFYQKAIHRVRPWSDSENPRFFYFLMHALAKRGVFTAGGNPNTIDHLTAIQLRHYRLPFPGAIEQRAIANHLDRETAKIDALVAKKERLVELLREKRTALITRAVTRGLDPNVPMKDSGVESLGEIPAHWDAGALSRWWTVLDCKHQTVPFFDEGIPVASIGEVHGLSVDLSAANRTSIEEYERMIEGGRAPGIGDIIYSRNATVGEAAIVDNDDTFCMGQDVCLIRSDFDQPLLLLHTLRSRAVLAQLEALMVGSTFKRINVGQIKKFFIAVPPKSEQEDIAQYAQGVYDATASLINRVREAVDILKEFRTALISAAVTGKIDVREAMPG